MRHERDMLPELRDFFIVHIAYGVARLIIPICIYLKHSLRNLNLVRFIIPWIASNINPNRSSIKDEAPWITFQARQWLEGFLSKNKNIEVFEYGSGGSTLFFSKKVRRLVSVEHDPAWFEVVDRILKEKKILNCEYLLFESQLAPDGSLDFSDPESFASKEYPGGSFEAYVKSIDAFPDQGFDLIFIDGRARPSCILHARNKVKPGGFIILDNSERDYYSLGKELLSDWERMDFFGPGPYGRYFWQTSIWKRPQLST